ncbi:MAG TPA: pantetheine-phosphate adenylyltransferase [Candidatus Omnitrophota bacterium]|nr:pantetheine-phosphate adenylyltransferase [Candidatus Omnitrophota bacterium]HOX09983.1 pantetheine-phosphate adenylyltransferase [Candidatus Omnitrophota bacterium]HPN66115.1 pantetheine-phosphate adenylyltransferase [Candidatus Omnitrophota bacterium]HRZ67744.1 pantetheine-phosphate adenylyltransferase [Candidatus Omnitrophota bacterium]
MKNKAVYPGTFDPVTFGHIDLVKRALKIFDTVIIAVARNADKAPLFGVEERIAMLRQATRGMKGVVIESFDGLAVDYVRSKGSVVMVRGLRMISDFEYEFQMALTNRKIGQDIETIFMMPSESYSYLSSKLIKEAFALGADVKDFVPPFVARALAKKLR